MERGGERMVGVDDFGVLVNGGGGDEGEVGVGELGFE